MSISGALFELEQWARLTSGDHEGAALTLSLPHPWDYLGLETHTLGGITHELAFFAYEGVRFALVPGSTKVTLGYDSESPWIPDEALREDIRETEVSFDGPFIETCLESVRSACVRPFLMEVAPTQATWVEELDEGSESWDLAAITCLYRKESFRLPTSDEWEYACRGGTKTLWRWGDTIPNMVCRNVLGWDLHRRPNAFGLIFNDDPYWTELCDDGAICSGDGGASVCGGHGIVASWLPLASAFREDLECFEMAPTEYGEQMYIRRVWPL